MITLEQPIHRESFTTDLHRLRTRVKPEELSSLEHESVSYCPKAIDVLNTFFSAHYERTRVINAGNAARIAALKPYDIARPADIDEADFATSVGSTVLRLYTPHLLIVDTQRATRDAGTAANAVHRLQVFERTRLTGVVFALTNPEFSWDLSDEGHVPLYDQLRTAKVPAACLPTIDAEATTRKLLQESHITDRL